MAAIIAITAPIFLLIALGFVAVRADWVPREGALAMGRYVLRFALPALVFNALAKRPLGEMLVPQFLVVYAGGSLIAFTIGMAVSTALRRTRPLGNAFFGMGVSMSNSGYIGYPLVAQLLGADALIAVAMTMLVEILLIMLSLVAPFDPTLTQAALVLAGLPMVTIFPLLAQRYGQGEQCASALLVTTLLSFLTLNLGLWALGVGSTP
ncbi:MAG: AEC family transporter [Lamprocystis purpurea]|uniref:AEC family transporter n=1 Tax=Lamprocystis purpurea TaxID=61598 RepID=UPI00037DEBA3|nr:AEC family transporter [Lamprocystis purpurea]MBV5273011.1 AEC family transporter [Lamprocystis purpurea]